MLKNNKRIYNTVFNAIQTVKSEYGIDIDIETIYIRESGNAYVVYLINGRKFFEIFENEHKNYSHLFFAVKRSAYDSIQRF